MISFNKVRTNKCFENKLQNNYFQFKIEMNKFYSRCVWLIRN